VIAYVITAPPRQCWYNVVAQIPLEQPNETFNTISAR
jgi:hypothetical protein